MGQCCSKSSIIDNNVILDSEKEIELVKILHLNSESINNFTLKKKMFKGFNSRIYLLEKNQKLYIGKQYSSFKKHQLEIKILRENTFHKFPTLYCLYDTPQLHMIVYPYIEGQDIYEYYSHDLTMSEFELQQVVVAVHPPAQVPTRPSIHYLACQPGSTFARPHAHSICVFESSIS